jgi:hypothetical protein
MRLIEFHSLAEHQLGGRTVRVAALWSVGAQTMQQQRSDAAWALAQTGSKTKVLGGLIIAAQEDVAGRDSGHPA